MMSFATSQTLPPQQQKQMLQVGGGGGDDGGDNHNLNNSSNYYNTNAAHGATVMESMHMDYIHHIAFDVYGRRMATCSGDRFVRVWDLTDRGDWNLVGEWQAHRGSVTKLSWAHPEFGSVLATCGSDSDAKIWEERTHAQTVTAATATSGAGTPTVGGSSGSIMDMASASATTGAAANSSLASRWTIKTQLTEARKAVSCLEFAPRHWGLKLATGSADGSVRIYEAVDITNLSQWPLAATLQAFDDDDHQDNATARSSPQNLGVLCLSWCTGRFEPPTLVVGGNRLKIFRYMESSRSWQPLLQLPSSSSQILDVAWAPNVGRRFHYIASAEDSILRVHKLTRTYPDSPAEDKSGQSKLNKATSATAGINSNKLEVKSSQEIETNAWRCQWNVTGTVLASAGDAGAVQMWKSDSDGTFQCVAVANPGE